MATIYKICDLEQWSSAERDGVFRGAPVDLVDGFIHFSAPDQVAETAHKHFSGCSDLLLVAVDTTKLGAALRWEPSRGGALFPHLYADMPLTAVCWTAPLLPEGDGFAFPPGVTTP